MAGARELRDDEFRTQNRIGERALMAWPVLLLARALGIGGSERQLTEIAKTLDCARFEPRAGCFRLEGLRALELADAWVAVVPFPIMSFPSAGRILGARPFVRYLPPPKLKRGRPVVYPPTV